MAITGTLYSHKSKDTNLCLQIYSDALSFSMYNVCDKLIHRNIYNAAFKREHSCSFPSLLYVKQDV